MSSHFICETLGAVILHICMYMHMSKMLYVCIVHIYMYFYFFQFLLNEPNIYFCSFYLLLDEVIRQFYFWLSPIIIAGRRFFATFNFIVRNTVTQFEPSDRLADRLTNWVHSYSFVFSPFPTSVECPPIAYHQSGGWRWRRQFDVFFFLQKQ